jgi:HSP90 family molecular chaperone
VKTVSVQVQNDHLERMSKVQKPIVAVEELISNGLDADATRVRVDLAHSKMGALQEIRVSDDGHGLAYEDALTAFGNLGGSWKRSAQCSRHRKRRLHGQAGKGRFRAFALARSAIWKTTYRQSEKLLEYAIRGHKSNLGTFG